MDRRVAVGLIVNPIAGMGGSVGLKGTDGVEILREAIARGARPLAAERCRRALRIILAEAGRIHLLAASGAMGEDLVYDLSFNLDVIGGEPRADSGPADTSDAARKIRDAGARFILFAGGDGTARDIIAAVGDDIPVIGIPCGVKMYSGVFARSPEAAGHMVRDLLQKCSTDAGRGNIDTILTEVMDIDEEDYRLGHLSARLCGYARCPRMTNRLQGPKARSPASDESAIMSAALEIADRMQPDHLYLIGPGTSANAVLEALCLSGSLLGVDAVQDHQLIGKDLTAAEIEQLVTGKATAIILGVIGGQGYVVGRGNQQISPAVIRQVGREGLIVISSQDKLARLGGEQLFVDTGDADLDLQLEGFVPVHTGAGRSVLMRLSAGR